MRLLERTTADLVQSAIAGDLAAFAELLRPEYTAAFRLAYGLLHDRDDAEDVVQDAAFTAWRRISNLRAGSPLRPWFLAIVANRCRAVKRNHWWSISSSEPSKLEAPPVDLASSIDLRRALRRMRYDERLVLVLRYYVDMPYEEIATTLGISPKA